MADVYVHVTAQGFHPNNRYRVVDAHTVAEPGWTSAAGMWGVPESDRQVCPVPITEQCDCVVQADLIRVDWHVFAGGRWFAESVPAECGAPVNVYVTEDRMAPVVYRHQAGECRGECTLPCGHLLTYGCDCDTIASEAASQDDEPEHTCGPGTGVWYETCARDDCDYEPPMEPQHTCGPGVNWGCAHPDCDGAVGD